MQKLQLKSERVEGLDFARGIMILLVVFGHLFSEISSFNILHNIIYAYHLPFFFIVSGLMFDAKRYGSFTAFLKRKLETLVCPYLLFAFASWLWYTAKDIYFARGLLPDRVAEYGRIFCEIFYARYSGTMSFNTPLWFVPCLFAALLIFYGCKKIVPSRYTG